MDGFEVALTVLLVVSIFGALSVGSFELFLIVAGKDDRRERKAVHPKRIRRIVLCFMALGLHVICLAGAEYNYYPPYYPKSFCSAQAVLFVFFLTGFGSAIISIGIYNVEKQIDPLTTNQHAIAFYILFTLAVAMAPTIVIAVGVGTYGTHAISDLDFIFCRSELHEANLISLCFEVGALLLGCILNIVATAIAILRPLHGTRHLTHCQRFWLSMPLIRFTTAILFTTTLMCTALLMEKPEADNISNQNDNSDVHSPDLIAFATATFGTVIFLTWSGPLLHFLRWSLCHNEHDPKFYILPKYMQRYRNTHPIHDKKSPSENRDNGELPVKGKEMTGRPPRASGKAQLEDVEFAASTGTRTGTGAKYSNVHNKSNEINSMQNSSGISIH